MNPPKSGVLSKVNLLILIVNLGFLALYAGFLLNRAGASTSTTYCLTEEATEAQIITEVEAALQSVAHGIVHKDADEIFSIFADNPNAHYVRQGQVFTDVSAAIEKYKKGFAAMQDKIEDRSFSFTDKHFDVINAHTVLFTGTGVINTKKPNGEPETPWTIAYTIQWHKDDDAWRAINMHISW